MLLKTKAAANSRLRLEARDIVAGVEQAPKPLPPPDQRMEIPAMSESVPNAPLAENFDVIATAEMVDSSRKDQSIAPPTERELGAAKTIIRLFRLTQRRKVPQKGLVAARARHYQAFHAQSQRDTMQPRYKLLCLGPLPHALVCLDYIIGEIATVKKEITMRLDIAEHAEYERLTQQRNDVR